MAIILTKIKYCSKTSNFYRSSISYLTYCVTANVMKVWQCNLPGFFLRFSILYPPGLFKKNHEKNSEKMFC